ncbi:MAG: hypothetical protein JRN24_04235 [Nitrososphaerota archaeon]|nr:hypothetical protein [Nitrososphaerota archaeon]
MLQGNLELGSGLVRFRSKEQAREYLEALLAHYKAKSEEYGGQMGELLRVAQPTGQESKESKPAKEGQKVGAKGWMKMGSLPVNMSDPQRAISEVTLKIVEDYRLKIEKTGDALKSLDEIESHSSGGQGYVFFISKGVPEAVVVEETAKKQELFVFSAKFRAV